MISADDYLSYADDAIDGMAGLVEDLGDDLANLRPDLPGANSPFVILTHCLGVMEYWAGHVVAGRTIERDRPAEFRASGSVADLVRRTRQAQRRLRSDMTDLQASAPPRGVLDEKDRRLPLGRTQGGALMHVYEELAQHRGQMEITADILRGRRR